MMTNYLIAVPIAGLMLGGVLKLAGGAIEPKSGIEIHSLTFTNNPQPSIIQDRTVIAANRLTARWDAYITFESDGETVQTCKGGGWWDYKGGHLMPVIEIDQWTGYEGCWASLPKDIELKGCASYAWGDGQHTFKCSQTFRKQ